MDEGRKIARWRMANIYVEAIAENLGRHGSSIFRELKRNLFNDDEIKELTAYYCTVADQNPLNGAQSNANPSDLIIYANS